MAEPSKATTVWQAFYDILRAYGMTTMFGNPGSTEQPMLKNFPADFEYIMALQEASVVGMADGYSQATRKPVVVSLHTAAGTGNGMAGIFSAAMGKTPLIVIAGQQHRDYMIGEPFLMNRDATTVTKPFVKWAYEPCQAKDVPAALIRAIAIAVQPPAGPVYLSIPMNDWDQQISVLPTTRVVSTRVAPDPVQVVDIAARLRKAKQPALVYGQEVDKSLGWDAGVKLAELLDASVYIAPGAERSVFPETHPLFKGALPMARGPLSSAVTGYDLLLVVGAEVFRYYPFVEGPVLPPGTELIQITNDPHDASTALTGDSMLSDAKLALEALTNELVAAGLQVKTAMSLRQFTPATISGKSPMTAMDAFTTVASLRGDSLLLQESPSNAPDLLRAWPAYKPEHYFTFASGGLGWDGPAAVGVALAQKHMKTGKHTVLVIGDGSFNYSCQSVYTAVQQKTPLIILVPRNEMYAVLQEFAVLEDTPNVPALNLPGLDATAVAAAYGCQSYFVKTVEELRDRFAEALKVDGPVLIEFPIDKELRPLIAANSAHPR